MRHSNTLAAGFEDSGPRLGNGRRVGRYIREAGSIVWARNISARHILYTRDALTINRGLLQQIRRAGVALVRYRLKGAGSYEIALDQFVADAVQLPGLANGEDVFCVPRANWRFTPELGGLTLFAFEGRA